MLGHRTSWFGSEAVDATIWVTAVKIANIADLRPSRSASELRPFVQLAGAAAQRDAAIGGHGCQAA